MTNLDRARLAGAAIISATPDGLAQDSVAARSSHLRFARCQRLHCIAGFAHSSRPNWHNSSLRQTKPWVVSKPSHVLPNKPPKPDADLALLDPRRSGLVRWAGR